MQKSHIHDNGFEQYTCITGSIPGCSLEELRIQDHFNMKEKRLPVWKQYLVQTILTKNASKRDNRKTVPLKETDIFPRTSSSFLKT